LPAAILALLLATPTVVVASGATDYAWLLQMAISIVVGTCFSLAAAWYMYKGGPGEASSTDLESSSDESIQLTRNNLNSTEPTANAASEMKGSMGLVDQNLDKGPAPPHEGNVADEVDDPEAFLGLNLPVSNESSYDEDNPLLEAKLASNNLGGLSREDIRVNFDRYDLDSSGTLNTAEELKCLVTNLIFKTDSKRKDQIVSHAQAIIDQLEPLSDKNALSLDMFVGWYQQEIVPLIQ